MSDLSSVELGDPTETARRSIDLFYQRENVKEPLEVSIIGRGLQQLLLVFTCLYSHHKNVLLIDEPDAYMEILRQRQVYVLLREIAENHQSQVVLVTHQEVVLDKALDHNLTLLLGGRADDLAAKSAVNNALKHFGAAYYMREVQRGYVLYVDVKTDINILRALFYQLYRPVTNRSYELINAVYMQRNYL